MLHLEEVAPIQGLGDAVGEAVESTRRTLASVDRNAIEDAAESVARSVLPRRWFRSEPRRWPWVVAALVLLTAAVSFFVIRQSTLTVTQPPAGTGPMPDTNAPAEPDSSDVIEGEIGEASLRDPATSGPEGADLSRLLEIEVDLEDGAPVDRIG